MILAPNRHRLRLALKQLAARVLRFEAAHLDRRDVAFLSCAEAGEPMSPAQVRRVLELGREIVEGSDRLESAA